MPTPELTASSLPELVEIDNVAEIGTKYPLNKVTEWHAEKFYERYKLPIEKDVGWDQAAMAGAAIEMMKTLGKSTVTRDSDIDLNLNTWILGITVGVPFFAGAILGLILTDPATRILRFGRRGAICLAGIFSFVSVIGSASVNKWHHLLGFRILLGAGMAGKASIVPILLSETSPKNVRGFLLVFWQLFVAFGLAAGSVANMSVYQLNIGSSWRYMFIAAFIPALLLLSLILFSPESPRWLLKESGASERRPTHDPLRRSLVQDAFKSLLDLRGESVPVLAAGELFLMHKRLIDEQNRLWEALAHSTSSATKGASRLSDPLTEVVKHINWWQRVSLMLFRSGATRRAHMAAAAVMISQQLCGINLIAFLSDVFFRYSFFHGQDETTPHQNVQLLGASLGLMLLNCLATIPALFIIDRSNGRRRVLNWSFPCMAASLLASALVLRAPEQSLGRPTVSAIVGHYVFLAMFVVAYSVGEGPAAFVISAEVFPLVNRELGMSLAVYWNFMGAGLLAVISPWLLSVLGQFWLLMLFAALNMVAWFFCVWLIPNTGNEDLEAVYDRLSIDTDYMFFFTFRTSFRNLTKVVDFCAHFGRKTWKESGWGDPIEDPVTEFEKSQSRIRSNQSDEGSIVDSNESRNIERS
ncbi:sugar transporter [Paraphoma chrysanthemicola]|uniref:Sugar transporter n=1 Tax=Paraphoma chrysanthemicola TaxID=798071 RepID=A0A8K0QU57_9PLEO|nr:sugar transporter [Paraphoma chrysanthemicola]